jgi:hypothetical protein
MITKNDVLPRLLDACPSFQTKWESLLREGEEVAELLYISLGVFARHLLELHQSGQREEFPAVARAIESLHVDGDAYVREATTIGLLEGIQNVWSNSGADPEAFMPNLLPVSAKWWHSLNDFWAGRVRFVGENL